MSHAPGEGLGGLHRALLDTGEVDPADCAWMAAEPFDGDAALAHLRAWEVRARWAGVHPLPPPGRTAVYDWGEALAAVRWGCCADGSEAERLWQTVTAVFGIPRTASVDRWRPPGTAGPRAAVALLRAMVEQYPAAFDPVARCNEFIWHTLPAPAVVLRRCLRILKAAAYAHRVEPAADDVPPDDVRAAIAAADADVWPVLRRHLPAADPSAADEDALVDAVRLLRTVARAMPPRTDDPLSAACRRLDLPEDVARVVSAMKRRRIVRRSDIR